MIYTPDGRRFTADLTTVSGDEVSAHWYDPRTGAATRVPDVRRGPSVEFEPPSGEDWVLVVDDTARGFGPPGR
jgi:hypothetical protein